MLIVVSIVCAIVAIWALRRAFSSPKDTRTSKDTIVLPPLRVTVTTSHESLSDQPEEENSSSDNWEGSFWDAANPKSLRKDVLLDYVDGRGNKTQRRVSVRQFDEKIDLFIGHCHLRNATRTFKFSRIASCADAETGEVISDFRAYCVSEYEKSPDHSIDRLLEDNIDALSIAFYVGKADGRLTKKENTEIANFAASLVGDSRLDADLIKKMYANWGVPSLQSFRLAVGRVKSRPDEYRRALVQACESIVATDAKSSDAERETLNYVKQKLLDNP